MATFSNITYQNMLTNALDALALSLSDTQIQQILGYLNELQLWNKKFNLTAIKEPSQMMVKHVFDSLSVLPYLPEGRLLDVGTGAGLPGVIIAICQPERSCTLLDSNSKKIRFIRQAASTLGLKNINAEHRRIELAAEIAPFDVITSRAFSSLVDFASHCEPLVSTKGCLFAMKGVLPHEEMAALADTWHMTTQRLVVPTLSDERHAVILRKAHVTLD